MAVRNPNPLPRLAKVVATIEQLRSMTSRERADATCRVCQITYVSKSTAQACQRWHAGKGT